MSLDGIRESLHYNPETGEFTWLQDRSNVKAGSVAGCVSTDSGYTLIRFAKKIYRAHRLAFYFMTGRFPEFVDHKDNIRTNNTWANLRECTRGQNRFNSGMRKNNTSGVKGVSWSSRGGNWVARVAKSGKVRHVGYFDDIELAELVVQEAREAMHGEYANHY